MNKTLAYLCGIAFVICIGYILYLHIQVNKLIYKQEQDKINVIAKQDSIDTVQDSINSIQDSVNTAHHKALIAIIQNKKAVFVKQDSIDNNKRKKLNNEIDNLNIPYDSLPKY